MWVGCYDNKSILANSLDFLLSLVFLASSSMLAIKHTKYAQNMLRLVMEASKYKDQRMQISEFYGSHHVAAREIKIRIDVILATGEKVSEYFTS